MNQYIVSQWFEYKDDLKSYFEDCVSEAEHTHILFRNTELEYPHTFIPIICNEVLIHLLKLVINRGKKTLKLRLVDSMDKNIPSSCCCDTMFFLRDKERCYWIIDTFYGSFENMVFLDRAGVVTKEQWVALLMHLSLGMVQRLRKCDELDKDSLIVLNRDSFSCRIKDIVDIRGLGKRHIFCRLPYTLEDMPRKSLDPLFTLMSDEQKAEIEKILDNVDKREEEQLSGELANLHHPEWKLARMGIGSERARRVVDKMAEFGLKGYIAVCYRSYYPPPFGYFHEHHKKNSFEMLEKYASSFNGDIYFIAVGSTLTKLLYDIEKRTMEFEKSSFL